VDKDREKVTDKISRLKTKQKALESSWGKTGNRSLLQFFIDITPDMVNAERCSIFVFNPESDTLWLYCGTDLQERQIQVPRQSSMAGHALSSGHYQVVSDLEEKAGIHEIVDNATGFTTCNTLSVPIFNGANDQAIGVLQILNKRGAHRFSNEDIALMQRLSGEVSRYVESIFKHQEVAEILVKIKKRIKSLENSLAREGIQKRLDQEMIASITPQKTEEQLIGRLH
jgi:hypothetical protein